MVFGVKILRFTKINCALKFYLPKTIIPNNMPKNAIFMRFFFVKTPEKQIFDVLFQVLHHTQAKRCRYRWKWRLKLVFN
jgi:hypothetical protein